MIVGGVVVGVGGVKAISRVVDGAVCGRRGGIKGMKNIRGNIVWRRGVVR